MNEWKGCGGCIVNKELLVLLTKSPMVPRSLGPGYVVALIHGQS